MPLLALVENSLRASGPRARADSDCLTDQSEIVEKTNQRVRYASFEALLDHMEDLPVPGWDNASRSAFLGVHANGVQAWCFDEAFRRWKRRASNPACSPIRNGCGYIMAVAKTLAREGGLRR